MKQKISLTIPGKPFGKQRPRVLKNGITYTPKETVNYETLIKELYIIQHFRKQLEGPVRIHIKAYFPIPKSVSKRKKEEMIAGKIRPVKKPDMDNIIKIIADALNGLAYRDDSQIVECTIEKYFSDEERVEIEIEEVS
jgi:Holliday junction resolvase RusA-like endonuclease